ncbi:VOC family protein [Humisphaera borealis]|uniref:VOC family protein n=1 Tax=Humisphaera borealis TaxID=2807512 RepID=A0A7M2X1Z6_9BACT|nr:VOC family protein [Humisphaera borealis]QOV91619.1 VOC family protein [Humisphaera borealis]
MIESIDHVNIVVADMELVARFYEDTLGFRRTKHATIRGDWVDATVGLKGAEAEVIYLELGVGPRIELARYVSPPGRRPIDIDLPNMQGIRHLAFKVSGIEAIAARLRAAGVKVFSEVQQVPDSQVTYAGGVRKYLLYFQDPEGNLLELCEYR